MAAISAEVVFFRQKKSVVTLHFSRIHWRALHGRARLRAQKPHPRPPVLQNVWKSVFLESSILACSARGIARASIYILPINCLSNLDSFWLLGGNYSSKTCSCNSPWNLIKKLKNEKNWIFEKFSFFFFIFHFFFQIWRRLIRASFWATIAHK